MPVIEHPVHSHGVRDADYRYGCHNRLDEFPYDMWLQDGWLPAVIDGEPTRLPRMMNVEFRMSHECRYDRSLSDSACLGCKHAGNGERYIAEQNQKGAL